MILRTLLMAVTCCLLTTTLNAQNKKDTLPDGWTLGAGFGFDFAQLLQIKPKQGAGQNQIGFGIATSGFAKYRKKRLAWDHAFLWQFGIQRLGSGIIAQGTSQRIPFQKSIDEFQYNVKFGYRTTKESKWFYAANTNLVTPLLPTYMGSEDFPGNFLKDVAGMGQLRSRFFSPATLNISVGIDFKPDETFSAYYSPLGAKFIFVPDDEIASLGVHGNPVEGEPDPESGRYTEFDNTFEAMGQTLRLGVSTKFMEDKGAFNSTLLLFSNYLVNPENIDVNWGTDLSVALVKNLQVSVNVNVFYDDDVRVQITDFSKPNGVDGLGKRVSLTQQLLIKYNFTI